MRDRKRWKAEWRAELARRVTYWREWAGLSKSELAKGCHVTPPTVTERENGDSAPTPGSQQLIADACGITMSRFWEPFRAPKKSAA